MDSRGKRKVVESATADDSDEEEYSLCEKTSMLGYGNQKEQNTNTSSSTARVAPAMDHYPMYLEYFARLRITDGVVENVGEPLQNELTYEEFLRQLLASRSDKRYLWEQRLGRIPGANLDLVIESPVDSFEKSGNVSSQEAGVSSETGEALHLHSSIVQITKVSQNPHVSASG
jgi:hypothetical protein